MDLTHDAAPLLNDTNSNQFREMCWACGSPRSVLVIEYCDETQVTSGIWCWRCSRAVHQDCMSHDHSATLGCPLFPPMRPS